MIQGPSAPSGYPLVNQFATPFWSLPECIHWPQQKQYFHLAKFLSPFDCAFGGMAAVAFRRFFALKRSPNFWDRRSKALDFAISDSLFLWMDDFRKLQFELYESIIATCQCGAAPSEQRASMEQKQMSQRG